MRVLLVGAAAELVALLTDRLPRLEVEIVTATSADQAREVMATAAVDLVLCNPSIAGDMASRFFSLLVEHGRSAGIPVLGLADDHGRLGEADLYEIGADAVLATHTPRKAVVPVVKSYLRKLVGERRRLLRDPVTGLANLSVFRDAFERAASLSTREREGLTLVVLHVGSLRKARREIGVQRADDLMRAVAEGVSEALRRSDLAARGSGDTLLLLLPHTYPAGAERVTEKVHDRLTRPGRLPDGMELGQLELSAGIAEAPVNAPFEEVLERALCALEPLWGTAERSFRGDIESASAWQPRILVGEDDDLTASIIRHRLERAGCAVVHAKDGAAVLELARESGTSLLILDVKMPYVDGFEALRRLRSVRSLRDIPIMMVTSMGSEDDIQQGFELGADDYLVKPFSPIELQARVQRLLARCA